MPSAFAGSSADLHFADWGTSGSDTLITGNLGVKHNAIVLIGIEPAKAAAAAHFYFG